MEILRTEHTRWDELYSLNIYGLRIGHVNEGAALLDDPMVMFLREVLTAYPCAAQMSGDPWQDDPNTPFSLLFTKDRFVLTSVGVYSHVTLFADADSPHGVYFPRFTPADLLVRDEFGDLLIDTLLVNDQPILYLQADETANSRLLELLAVPPMQSSNFELDWFRATTAIVPLVLVGGHDESCFHAVTRSPEHFTLLDTPLLKTETAIRESEWYQTNALYLHWSDEEYEWCLVFPCGEREHRRKCE